MKSLSKTEATNILGVAGQNVHNGNIRADEFLRELKGREAVKKFREMRDNDSTIGAVMYAVEQMLRDVEINVVSVDASEAAQKEKEFVESVLEDMEHTLDDHIAEALSFLSYGFSWFEVVYKRREGLGQNLKKKSKHSDGRMGVRKLACRSPWTIDRFDVEHKTGDILGIYQSTGYGQGKKYIPSRKSVYYRTTTINGDPSGRSILRNAYTSYQYLNNMQSIEAVGVERELAGIPVARVPAEYLSPDANEGQIAFLNELQSILRDVKFNDQGYIILPSDTYPDKDGAPTGERLVDVELMSSSGTRNIDIDPIIRRYQHDIARSVLSEFLMLGGGSNGSYALSKSKTDLFLRALESYITQVVDTLNKQLIEPLWELNNLNPDLMPKLVAGDVAPHDLKELGSYLRNLNGADINLADQPEIVDALLHNAELPELDRQKYAESLEVARQAALAPVKEGESEEEDEDQEDEEEVSKLEALQEEVLKASLEYLKDD
jgi:hypothetical protein